MDLPLIVYLQTLTACNGHCRYCPFDDIYGNQEQVKMSFECYLTILNWLKENNYLGRIGFLLHYEPTLDDRLPEWIQYVREILPKSRVEIATNGIKKTALWDCVDVVNYVPANTRTECTSRAGNVKACPEIMDRRKLTHSPCPVPAVSMCIAADGTVLLCCQDWRHEAIVGTYLNLTAARKYQLKIHEKVKRLELEVCRDCMDGKTAEEVGQRLGKRCI